VLADSSLPEDIRLALAENLHKELFSQVASPFFVLKIQGREKILAEG
jgi:hypothetical protein